MKKSRREFIKESSRFAAWGMVSASALSGCTSIDIWVSGDARDDGQMVTIIGGGLTGLTAALELKKNKIPYRIFEGSHRAGGRVLTLNDFNISGTDVELGAERISSEHTALLQLAQELKVPFQEVETSSPFLFFEKSGMSFKKDFQKEMRRGFSVLQQVSIESYGKIPQFLNLKNKEQFPKAEALDKLSVEEFLQRLNSQLTPLQKTFFSHWVRAEWGVEPSEVSALHLIHWARDEFKLSKSKSIKITGGNSVLVQALLDRVYGIIPDRFMRFGKELVSVRPSEEGWVLGFRSNGQYQEVLSHRIICTLPISQLKKIDGWQMIPLQPAERELIENIGFSGQGRVALGYENRNWLQAKETELGSVVLPDWESVQITESTPPKLEAWG